MWSRVSNGALIGTSEEVVEQVAAYRDAGADGLNIALRAPWSSDAVDAWLTDVVSTFRL